MKRFPVLLFLAAAMLCIGARSHRWIPPQPSAGGGGNNVTVNQVTGNNGSGVASVVVGTISDVTAGELLLVGVSYYGASLTPTAGMLTKDSGTSTIGTVELMSGYTSSSGTSSTSTSIYRVPVTGSGSITIRFTPTSSGYIIVGVARVSNVATSSYTGPAGSTSGTGTTHSTGSVTITSPGILFYVGSEIANGDFTRTYSDSLVFKVDSGSTTYTSIIQYKLVTGNATMTDTTGSDSSDWRVSYCEFKSN